MFKIPSVLAFPHAASKLMESTFSSVSTLYTGSSRVVVAAISPEPSLRVT